MPEAPSGTVTFLFSDIEHSTRLLQHLGDRYAEVLAAYRRLLREALQAWDGYEIDTAGDGFFAAFQRATHAVAAAVAAQRAVAGYPWPEGAASAGAHGAAYGRADPDRQWLCRVWTCIERRASAPPGMVGRPSCPRPRTPSSSTTCRRECVCGIWAHTASRTYNAPNACTSSSSQTCRPTSHPSRASTVAPTTCPCSPPRSSGASR